MIKRQQYSLRIGLWIEENICDIDELNRYRVNKESI